MALVIFRAHCLFFPWDKSEFQAGSSWGPVPWLGWVIVTMRGQFCVPHFYPSPLIFIPKKWNFHGRNGILSLCFPSNSLWNSHKLNPMEKTKSKPQKGLGTEATLSLFRQESKTFFILFYSHYSFPFPIPLILAILILFNIMNILTILILLIPWK